MSNQSGSWMQRATSATKHQMEKVKKYLPKAVDFHTPETWVGSELSEPDAARFQRIKTQIDRYLAKVNVDFELLLDIKDKMETSYNVASSFTVNLEVFRYLRIKLLSEDVILVENLVLLLDFLVKNSDYRVHLCLGQRKFMKTLSIVGRRHREKPGASHQRLADTIFNCIQAWAEAFMPRRNIYPHIWDTYIGLKTKHQIKFPRPDFDPTRVPIFLEPVHEQEKLNRPKSTDTERTRESQISLRTQEHEIQPSAPAKVEDLLDIGTIQPSSAAPQNRNTTFLDTMSQPYFGPSCYQPGKYDPAGGCFVSFPPEETKHEDPFEHPWNTSGRLLENVGNPNHNPNLKPESMASQFYSIQTAPSMQLQLQQQPSISQQQQQQQQQQIMHIHQLQMEQQQELQRQSLVPQKQVQQTSEDIPRFPPPPPPSTSFSSSNNANLGISISGGGFARDSLPSVTSTNVNSDKLNLDSDVRNMFQNLMVSAEKSQSNLREESQKQEQPSFPTLSIMADDFQYSNSFESTNTENQMASNAKEDISFQEDITPIIMPLQDSRAKKTAYTPPSSDPNVDVKYFGHQRVVTRKNV